MQQPRTQVRKWHSVRNVSIELGIDLHGPVCMGVDNTAAITIADNRGVTARTKHFSDAIHYIRHMVDHMWSFACVTCRLVTSWLMVSPSP